MTTWTKVDDISTTYTVNQNLTYYGQRTNFNQEGITFNQSGVRFNNWFTTYENRNVIYTDNSDVNTNWQYNENINLGKITVGTPIGLLLTLTNQITTYSADWNDVDVIRTTWVNV